ncbi:Glycogen phosphorylase [uncultured Desulfobacterium sp.]|uniref:Glycogen phosphorylase n=1 Tax=uncultured Desulfobacterium sp. TaxID=201089 RepID=A0A445N3X1_9BACT|nr:Glycogen phosphorylase [uncultured Desulfobacterium sp.]
MIFSRYYLIPPLPQGLEGLAELGLDLRWSWSHATDALWQRIDPELWELTRNPWLILQSVSSARLETLARDSAFTDQVQKHLAEHRAALDEPSWYSENHSATPLTSAYFSMEFGLSEALPIYSGGLGILAGDYLKTASDLGVPLVGIGLLYQQGYFRQVIDAGGAQTEFYPYNDPSQLPILPVRDSEGEWLKVKVDLPGRKVHIRVWEAKVGRVKLYLLDSNDPANSPADQCITAELYGGGPELRLQQEMVLGIGGWHLLRLLGINIDVCHLNEGHAALAVLERVRSCMEDTGQPFEVALTATRAGNLFTTHTPVEAGFDRFPQSMARQYLGAYADQLGIGLEGLLALGRMDPKNEQEPFNMAYLAIRGSGRVNAVSRLHGRVSRRIFQPLFPRWPEPEVPITHVTNGVHVPSWDSAAADALWHETCGKRRWMGSIDTIEDLLKDISDQTLWAFRNEGCGQLVHYARERLIRQIEARGGAESDLLAAEKYLDPNALTMGFARRFAAYKRPNLLLHYPDRLASLLLSSERPVQLIIAGKAHPQDATGKALVRAWTDFIRRPEIRSHVVFLADYDMVLAERLVQGVDLWINTPRRPWEASGTSGMKVLVNGGLNLSELDGWWAEAYRPEVGWAIGDGSEHGDDPAWDAREAEQLYWLLEQEVLPAFYDRGPDGIPGAWVQRMRFSMAELTPRFSANRMVREYLESLYLPAAQTYRDRTADGAKKAQLIYQKVKELKAGWPKLDFGELEIVKDREDLIFKVPVFLKGLNHEDILVQLYAEPKEGEAPDIYPMIRERGETDSSARIFYSARIPAKRPAVEYTPRIIPALDGALVPIEADLIFWYR